MSAVKQNYKTKSLSGQKQHLLLKHQIGDVLYVLLLTNPMKTPVTHLLCVYPKPDIFIPLS